MMKTADGDCIIIGASNMDHLKANVQAIKAAQPLHKSVVDAFGQAWKLARPGCPKYFR